MYQNSLFSYVIYYIGRNRFEVVNVHKIELPDLVWFMEGNEFTGSITPDRTKGSICQVTFNYKVKIINHKHVKSLVAGCFLMMPWNIHLDMKELTVGQFEASDFGIRLCEDWIKSKAMPDGKTYLISGKKRKEKSINEKGVTYRV